MLVQPRSKARGHLLALVIFTAVALAAPAQYD